MSIQKGLVETPSTRSPRRRKECTIANVLLWLFLTIALYFVFLSHSLVAASLFPDYVAKCQQQYNRPPIQPQPLPVFG